MTHALAQVVTGMGPATPKQNVTTKEENNLDPARR